MRRGYTVRTHLDTCTVREAAELVGVSEQTIRRKMKSKKFRYLKPDKHIQIVRQSLVDWWLSTGTGVE